MNSNTEKYNHNYHIPNKGYDINKSKGNKHYKYRDYAHTYIIITYIILVQA
jgi:hypothetical protein